MQRAGLICKSWETTNIEMAQLSDDVNASLDQGALSPPTTTLERLGCTNPDINGAGTVTAAVAIYLAARFASQPSGGLLAAAFLRGGDTDTLASMDAILGGLHGIRWTGGLADAVQDSDYLVDVATRSAARRVADLLVPDNRPDTERKRLLSSIAFGQRFRGPSPMAAKSRLSRSFPSAREKMHRATMRLDDGQVVFVDVPRYGYPSRSGRGAPSSVASAVCRYPAWPPPYSIAAYSDEY
jgi:hypothetical protein